MPSPASHSSPAAREPQSTRASLPAEAANRAYPLLDALLVVDASHHVRSPVAEQHVWSFEVQGRELEVMIYKDENGYLHFEGRPTLTLYLPHLPSLDIKEQGIEKHGGYPTRFF